jgi:predicted RNase H-related nuclease YkuK (DUF458 family)
MEDKIEMKWKRMTQGPIGMPLFDYLRKLFNEEKEKGYDFKVCVGTDSQRSGKGYKFATVIIISTFEDLGGGAIVGRGGMIIGANYFTTKYKKNKDGVKERMLYEVSKSIEVAYEISPLLDEYDIPLEIHADINPDVKWESNKALQDAVGYILGMGYDFKVKPDSYAASKGADKMSRM